MRLLTYIQTYDLFHPCHSPLYLLPVTRHILYYLLHTYSFHDDHLKGKKKKKGQNVSKWQCKWQPYKIPALQFVFLKSDTF